MITAGTNFEIRNISPPKYIALNAKTIGCYERVAAPLRIIRTPEQQRRLCRQSRHKPAQRDVGGIHSRQATSYITRLRNLSLVPTSSGPGLITA